MKRERRAKKVDKTRETKDDTLYVQQSPWLPLRYAGRHLIKILLYLRLPNLLGRRGSPNGISGIVTLAPTVLPQGMRDACNVPRSPPLPFREPMATSSVSVKTSASPLQLLLMMNAMAVTETAAAPTVKKAEDGGK
ncbi:hypothetical protein EGR_10278 [Echinococcus granulosus]|uniref:Uncharacterized protein n=1 Tax=Echinococcus granulosus TaxID=6210 RepID=W6U170_ECHGR|nr:hypothetical protein EGR_10278 [Echinococcus granulosus]EUB54860.1 hypothetical protein EGR_10278 [Echinococcus granulosus]